ncbi:MAG: recombinase family protein [Ruminococcaceae bacterium]|nr:recombinase family protein [Oscillospiraceae bacterium]
MKLAAVYIRVSTDDQAEYSPDSQLRELKAWAAGHGYIISPEYIFTDVGASGRKAKKRSEFMRMITAAKSKPKPFDAILVWKFSRFARNQEESIVYKSLLRKECGIDVISITEETQDNIFGSLIERIIEWMDEFYSIRLGEEVTTKMTLAAERGVVQTVAPFGYSKKPDEPMVIVPDEAQWVKYIFDRFASGGTMLRIAKDLNDNGVRTHRGNLFENRTIEYILNNPTYKGYVRWTPSGNTVGKRIYDSPDTITSKGDFEPIISEELFEAAQIRYQEQRRRNKRGAKPEEQRKHWLSGLLYCSNCGAALTYAAAHNGFQCYKYSKGTCKVSHYVSARKLEAAVLSAVEQVTVTESFVKDITRMQPVNNVIDYSPQLSRLETMLERAKRAYTEGIDTLEEYSANKKRIVAEIEEIKLKETEQQVAVDLAPVEEVRQTFDGVVALLKSDCSKEEKHRAIAGIVEKIIYKKADDSIDIFFYL